MYDHVNPCMPDGIGVEAEVSGFWDAREYEYGPVISSGDNGLAERSPDILFSVKPPQVGWPVVAGVAVDMVDDVHAVGMRTVERLTHNPVHGD